MVEKPSKREVFMRREAKPQASLLSEEGKQKRLEAKKRVRAESPEMADFLNEVIAEFGIVKMAVWLGDERVL